MEANKEYFDSIYKLKVFSANAKKIQVEKSPNLKY